MKTKRGAERESILTSSALKKSLLITAVLFSLFLLIRPGFVNADPTGASITSNVTSSAPSYSPDNRTDAGGTITTIVMDVTQQNNNWKAYVGNVSGVLTLDDANGNTIYQWSMSDSEVIGEVYTSRNSSPLWVDINCSTNTTIDTEDTDMGFTGISIDSINRTFNESTHNTILVAGKTIPSDQCRSTATYVNSTRQDQGSAYFQVTLLEDGSNLIYSTPIKNNYVGYDNETIVDFQILVADDVSSAASTYYFFVEIG